MKANELKQLEIKNKIMEAMRSEDEESMAKAFAELNQDIEQSVMKKFDEMKNESDKLVLQNRGVRVLTSEEMDYYQKFIQFAKGGAKQAGTSLTSFEPALPVSIIEDVIGKLTTEHPLLSAINFMDTQALAKWVLNGNKQGKATWSKLETPITAEVEGKLKAVDLTLCKLTAFMYVSNDMLDLGPAWVDQYVRACLTEAIALGLEEAIVAGTGKDMPIGMMKDVSDSVTITGGEYPDKAAGQIVALKKLNAEEYGKILAKLCVDEYGNKRTFTQVLLVVNPVDYFTKIFPAINVLNVGGTWVADLSFPTNIVVSVAVPTGKAIFGLASNYFCGIGAGTRGGRIEFSNDYKFIEDLRTYKVKLYGNGRAEDNTSFILADISALEAGSIAVNVVGQVTTKTTTP